MGALPQIFTNNILPILLAASAGYFLGRYIELDPRTVSRIVFYIFSPALVFNLLTENKLHSGATFQIILFALANTLVIATIAYCAGKYFKLERKLLVAMMISAIFVNAGNYGLSLNLFAFGETTLAYASIYFVMSSLIINTLGIFIASMGKADIKESLIGLLKFPTLYAAIIGLVFNSYHWQIPLPIDRAVATLGQAAIPGMLVLLGLQLQRASMTEQRLALGLATSIRLVAAPLVAIGLSYVFKLNGPALQAGVTESSMPTAVMVTVLATEFDTYPSFVTTVITATTLLSPLTLTPLLYFLGA